MFIILVKKPWSKSKSNSIDSSRKLIMFIILVKKTME